MSGSKGAFSRHHVQASMNEMGDSMASVMLDAGHGGFDNGAMYQGRKEKDDTLNLVLAVGNILQNQDVDVLYTRTEDEYQSPTRKAQIANESGADYFVSIHRNSSTQPNQYSGVQSLVYEDAGAPAVFARNINNALAKVGFHNIGVEERKNLAVLRRTTMPAVLVEVGFINTDMDNQLFDTKFPEMARAIADGILQSISEIEGGMQMQEMQDMYTVELGVFAHEENARALARILQEDGYDCYIERQERYHAVRHGRFRDKREAEKMAQKLYQEGYETRIMRR